VLILTRKLQEAICIGDQVVIKVMDVRGKEVRIGIEAPPEMPIHRAEMTAEERKLYRRGAALVEMQ